MEDEILDSLGQLISLSNRIRNNNPDLLRKFGIWSIKQATNVTPQSKPTYWREIPFPQSNLRDKIKELSDFREYRIEYLQEPVTHTDK